MCYGHIEGNLCICKPQRVVKLFLSIDPSHHFLTYMQSQSSGDDHAEKLTAPASSLHTTQPAARVPFPLPTPPEFSAAPPLPVQPSVHTPFPLPAHPGHFPSSQSSSSLTSSTPQRGLFCTTTHLSELIASDVPETQRMSGCDTAPVMGSRVPPSSPCCPNSLANNPASARSHGLDAVLRSRSDQGVKRKRGRKGEKTKDPERRPPTA
ncbi:hypothetical protein B9Z19DRAFT_1111041 [Tuber borchii]|uniref:Uncharacterized protein n=1 Tax=Tuber borchii TaxID=42251 RepID=A0A2T6ZE75_TUBBO|nr:hypothetical protein B9Z19DRAFT_1111041 [Tuber borchii]